ncbi:hypothetical protein BP6252_08296 [Coleophoma cylindrospora]|uniref:2EXR domain-containing protein n=1 Tax=Coleophoma cylindrospora TaxID=1849047 RepID=A0A3D8R5K1_9HELO|nr:hypothetical protein BP6252_08296 [Coleophoma cylindrospora]
MATNMLDEVTAVIESSTSTGQSAASFTLFNELPTELCLKIWRRASFLPRTVVISYMSPGANTNSIPPWPAHFKSSQKPAALLHVNSEARKCGQMVYTTGPWPPRIGTAWEDLSITLTVRLHVQPLTCCVRF